MSMVAFARMLAMAAGLGTLAACTTPAAEQQVRQDAFELRGTVTNAAGGPVPEGVLTISLMDQGTTDIPPRMMAETTVESPGDAHSVVFTMQVPREELALSAGPGFLLEIQHDGRLVAGNPRQQPYDGSPEVELEIEPMTYVF